MADPKTFCPYDHEPLPIPCPPGTLLGYTPPLRCRALQDNGSCTRLEADRALVRLSKCTGMDDVLLVRVRGGE